MTTIFTVGHSNHDAAKFIRLLKSQKIDFVVDVRAKPRSRFPHFNQDMLGALLRNNKIEYRYGGNALGGLHDNIAPTQVTDRLFVTKMDQVIDIAKAGACVALMCSEGKPCECHRAGKLLAWYHRERPALETKHLLPDFSVLDAKEYEPKVIKEVVWPTFAAADGKLSPLGI